MHGLTSHDGGNVIDWGKTSIDYSAYRPGPPPNFYALLQALGVGIADQAILDLGTGNRCARQKVCEARYSRLRHGCLCRTDRNCKKTGRLRRIFH